MKKIIVTKYKDNLAKRAMTVADSESVFVGDEDMTVSDGYHTMDELYDHRMILYISLCRSLRNNERMTRNTMRYEVWRSKLHSDGTFIPDWFILGIGIEPGKQITYHIPNKLWNETHFATTLERAPEWDKHNSYDVLVRLRQL